MRCTLTRDDISLLSQWIKNRQVETCRFLAETVGCELHFCPSDKNNGSHQFLNWWQQQSTGLLLCYGVRIPHLKEQTHPQGVDLFFGYGLQKRYFCRFCV